MHNAAHTKRKAEQRFGKLLLVFAVAVTASTALSFSTNASAGLSWGNVGTECRGTQRVDYARLYGLRWPQDGDWVGTCRRTKASNVSSRSNGKVPSNCRQGAANAIWAEWKYTNHASCRRSLVWNGIRERCNGNRIQTVSAKLDGLRPGASWEDACNSTDASGGVSAKGVSGKPDRCITTATGIFGEWDKNNVGQCAANHEWGSFKDEGCVKDASGIAASATGFTGEGFRAWSSVLWGIQGDWMAACRVEPVNTILPNGSRLRADHPLACTVAEADDALSWVAGAVIGAGTAFITAPGGALAIAAAGAAMSVGSQAIGEGLRAIDTGLNVWGVFWVEDSSCGVVDRSTLDGPAPNTTQQGRRTLAMQSNSSVCPRTASSLSGSLSCVCRADSFSRGTVWGSGTYTNDSSICDAALHSGSIGRSGGTVQLRTAPGQSSYAGSTRNGVSTRSYGPWKGSFKFE